MDCFRLTGFVVATMAVLISGGCSRTEPAPASYYGGENAGRYEGLSPQLQSTKVDLFYLTDREPEGNDAGRLHYGVDRSQSLAFGSVIVDVDENRSWDELVAWTEGEAGAGPAPEPEVLSVEELGRFPATPLPIVVDDFGHIVNAPEVEEEHARVREIALDELHRRLALTERKVVWLSIHGVQIDFDYGARVIALGWHKRGRWGVPIYYSWPAGQSGFISGYSYDRESGEFTIFHLKQLLRALGKITEIEKINLIAHSRGTDVLISALRELVIEARAKGFDPLTQFNIGNLVLIAPDMDLEVATQRILAEGLGRAVEHLTIYVSEQDWAIAFAQSLFSSKRRIGQMGQGDWTEEQKLLLRRAGNADIIFYEGSAGGTFGHSYYETPEILSDLFMLGEGRKAGAAHGRPLEPVAPHMWIIKDGYAP